MESMSDEDYFKDREPLSPEGTRRMNALVDEYDAIALELEEAKGEGELSEVLSSILDAYECAMTGEALPEKWEEDIEHAASILAKYP